MIKKKRIPGLPPNLRLRRKKTLGGVYLFGQLSTIFLWLLEFVTLGKHPAQLSAFHSRPRQPNPAQPN